MEGIHSLCRPTSDWNSGIRLTITSSLKHKDIKYQFL